MVRRVSVDGTIVNYATSFEGSEVFNLIEQEVTAGNRWDVDITEGAKEYNARIEAELCSGLPFKYALGSRSGSIEAAFTITPANVLPSVNVTGESDADSLQVQGAKVDRMRMDWSTGEYVTYEMEFTGKASAGTAATGNTDWSIEAATAANLEATWNGNTISEMQGGNLEIRNNLEARYAAGTGNDPNKIREQRLEASGAITVGKDGIGDLSSSGSLQINVKDIGVTIYVGSVALDEDPTEFTGHDIYEVEFSWTAQIPSSGSIVWLIDDSGNTVL